MALIYDTILGQLRQAEAGKTATSLAEIGYNYTGGSPSAGLAALINAMTSSKTQILVLKYDANFPGVLRQGLPAPNSSVTQDGNGVVTFFCVDSRLQGIYNDTKNNFFVYGGYNGTRKYWIRPEKPYASLTELGISASDNPTPGDVASALQALGGGTVAFATSSDTPDSIVSVATVSDKIGFFKLTTIAGANNGTVPMFDCTYSNDSSEYYYYDWSGSGWNKLN